MVRCSFRKATIILSALLAVFVLKYVLFPVHPEPIPYPAKGPELPSREIRLVHPTVSSGAQELSYAESDSIVYQNRTSPCDHFEKLGVLPAWTGAKNECIESVTEFPVLRTVLLRIATYLTWHEKKRSELQALAQHGESKPQVAQLRTLTWRCPLDRPGNCNGYGDRIMSMSFGLFYAAYSGRYYTIEWPRSYKDSDKVVQVFVPRILQWNHHLDISSTEERQSCGKFLYAKVNTSEILSAIFASDSRYKHVCFNQHRLDYCLDNVPLYLGEEVFHVLCQNSAKGCQIRRLVNGLLARLLLKFSSEVRSRAQEMAAGMGLQPYRYVAVHIRTGLEENVNASHFKYKLRPNWSQWSVQLRRAVAEMRSFRLNYPIFLATDADEARKWVLYNYPGGKVVTAQLKVRHVANLGTKEDEGDSYRDELIQNAAEFALLSKACVIVESRNSHFSMAASLLSGLPYRLLYT